MSQQDYEGFDLTMYNLFALLRQMYYTRGETETNFLQKSGGVLSGSLTIQGNLVINGQSYTIDTENLKVGDYTITLAKDNEQTLTSMVGMVVPKYDGTNYGFFGWDADGYAYVGDLTNYDGTSAITLANNSSLQRISTIDTTNTVVASNGVIYVYDATSHCFKKPTNDNKYYVIRNGAFVETELFTEQKSKNIDNALYNLGAFDTISGNTITRQTGYATLNKSDYTWTLNGNGTIYYMTAFSSFIDKPSGDNVKGNIICNKLTTVKYDTLYAQEASSGIAISSGGSIGISVSDYASLDEIEVEFKLATSYQEQVIENQPLLTLNQNGCNFLRNEWEKGLNLLPNSKGITLSNASAYFKVNFKQGQTYTFSIQGGSGSDNYALFMADLSGNIVQTITNGTSYNSDYTFTCNVSNGVTLQLYANSITNCNIMLNYGSHSYPYSEGSGAIVHQWDIEPVLLWENSSPNSAYTSTGSSNVISWNTEFKYLIFAMKYYNDRNGITYIKVKPISSGTNDLGLSNGANYFGRAFVHTSTTSGYFENAYANGSINSGNNVCIPIAIYGTNVL